MRLTQFVDATSITGYVWMYFEPDLPEEVSIPTQYTFWLTPVSSGKGEHLFTEKEVVHYL